MNEKTYFGFKFPVLLNRALWFSGFALFLLMAIAAFGEGKGVWPLCIAGVTCIIFANLDRIATASITTSGINIAISKAEISIAQLSRLIRMSATLQLATVQRAGRWGGFTPAEKEKFLEESVGLLRDAGISDSEIRELRYVPWDRFVLFDYVLAITGGSTIPQTTDRNVPVPEEVMKEWKALREIDSNPSGSTLRDFLKKCGSLPEDREELIKDYEYYQEHRRHRRPSDPEYLKEYNSVGKGLTVAVPATTTS